MSASEAIKCVQTSSPSGLFGQMANPSKIPPLVPLVKGPFPALVAIPSCDLRRVQTERRTQGFDSKSETSK